MIPSFENMYWMGTLDLHKIFFRVILPVLSLGNHLFKNLI